MKKKIRAIIAFFLALCLMLPEFLVFAEDTIVPVEGAESTSLGVVPSENLSESSHGAEGVDPVSGEGATLSDEQPAMVDPVMSSEESADSSSTESVGDAEPEESDPVSTEESAPLSEENVVDPASGAEETLSETVERKPEETVLLALPAEAVSDFDPALLQGIVLKNSNVTTLDRYDYSTKMQGEVFIDATGIPVTSTDDYLTNIEISAPADYVSSFTFPESDMISRVEERVDEATGLRKALVYLKPINSTQSFSIIYQPKANEGYIPQGYTIKPQAGLYTNGEQKIAGAENTASFTFKYWHNNAELRVGTLTGHKNEDDTRTIYGGISSDGQYLDVDKAKDIQFYNIIDFYHYRYAEAATLTVSLPTYMTKDGEKIAVFDPAKNPGWTVNADGTKVSMTKTADLSAAIREASTPEDALKHLHEQVLTLSFPGLELSEKSSTGQPMSKMIQLVTSLDSVPYPMEKDGDGQPINDAKDIYLPTTTNFFIAPSLAVPDCNKGVYGAERSEVDPGYMYNQETTYRVSLESYQPGSATRELIFKDGYSTGLSKETYFKIFRFTIYKQIVHGWVSASKQPYLTGTAVDGKPAGIYFRYADGREELAGQPDYNYDGWRLNQEVYDYLKALEIGYAQKRLTDPTAPIPSGLDVDNLPAELKANFVTDVIVRLNKDAALEPGLQFNAFMTIGHTDPYDPVDEDGMISNKALVTGTVYGDYEKGNAGYPFNLSPEVSYKPKVYDQYVDVTAYLTGGVNIRNINSDASISADLGLELQGSAEIHRGKFIFLLPIGLTVDESSLVNGTSSSSFLTGAEDVEIIRNYKNTGRTYIAYRLKDNIMRVGDMDFPHYENEVRFFIQAKVNRLATNQDGTGEPIEENKIYSYFIADDYVIPGAEGEDLSTSWWIVDRFDVDNDGDREELIPGEEEDLFVALPREIHARKWASLDGEYWSDQLAVDYSSAFSYRLEVFNNGLTPVDRVYLYDLLPKYGGGPDGKPVRNLLTGPVETMDPADLDKYTVYYSTVATDSDPSSAVVGAGWMTGEELLASG